LFVLLLTIIADVAEAQTKLETQDKAHGEIRGIVGIAGFPDDGGSPHNTTGGSILVRISSRLLIGAEVLYMFGHGQDRDLAFVPVLRLEIGRFRRVQPYLIGGVGLLRHRQQTITGSYSNNRATISVGIGTRIGLGGNLFISPELRGGWEPLLQSSIGIGYRF